MRPLEVKNGETTYRPKDWTSDTAQNLRKPSLQLKTRVCKKLQHKPLKKLRHQNHRPTRLMSIWNRIILETVY